MKFLLTFDRILSKFESVILVATLGLMIFMAFLQVILRNFFSSGILWGDIFLRHLVLWIAFLGASLATKENRHINVDLFSRLLRHKHRRWSSFITNLFSSFISGLLARAAYIFIRYERDMETTLFLDIPTWLFMSIILIGFIIITFRFLIKAISPDYGDQKSAEGE